MTLLYRFTHIEKLPGLLARECDCSPTLAKAGSIIRQTISHKDIMDTPPKLPW
jgi:hypothetical protein